MYTTDNILSALPIKHLVNQDGEPTMTQKLATGTKPSVSSLRVLLCPCVVLKATENVEIKSLNMRHQLQTVFCVIFLESHNIKKDTSSTYLVHVKQFLRMPLYLTRYFIVRQHTRHVHIKRHSLCDQKSRIFCTLHHLMNKLATL